MEKVTIRYSVHIVGSLTVFNPALGPGVVCMKEVTYDVPEDEREHIFLKMQIMEDENVFLAKSVQVKMEQLP